jgi:hypothetical protein
MNGCIRSFIHLLHERSFYLLHPLSVNANINDCICGCLNACIICSRAFISPFVRSFGHSRTLSCIREWLNARDAFMMNEKSMKISIHLHEYTDDFVDPVLYSVSLAIRGWLSARMHSCINRFFIRSNWFFHAFVHIGLHECIHAFASNRGWLTARIHSWM